MNAHASVLPTRESDENTLGALTANAPTSLDHRQSESLLEHNSRLIPGGVVSLNRKVEPSVAFRGGRGAYLFDVDDNRYIDYHAAFAPYLLGHGAPEVEGAVRRAQEEGWTLTGSGTTPWEGKAAQLLTACVPNLDRVQFCCTGSEATYHALRLSRTYTGREHIVLMQGGYNGWHDEVACNVMTPLGEIGPRVQNGEYPFAPLSAGILPHIADRVHIINFNDLESLEWAFKTYDVACLMSEPILQNIGVVKPIPGYLQGVRKLCDHYGVVWVMDEVKTGFRHALGGYQSLAGVKPDLSVFGKAIANGYPLGAIGGNAEIMDLFNHPDPHQRVMISGTYNGHPMPMAAAIGTMETLLAREEEIYGGLEKLGAQLQTGLEELFAEFRYETIVSRQSSAWCVYFMDHAPQDWHDLAKNHDMQRDLRFRRALIERGVFLFPLPTKQGSLSAAHTEQDVQETLKAVRDVLEVGI